MFVDIDFNLSKGNAGMMYTEISRKFNINDFPLMPLVEYNGGLGVFEVDDNVGGYSIPNAYLVGISYPFQIGNLFMDTYVAYKYNAFKETSHDVQWTIIWTGNFASDKFTICGFADLWTENKDPAHSDSDKKVIFFQNLKFGIMQQLTSLWEASLKLAVTLLVEVKFMYVRHLQ